MLPKVAILKMEPSSQDFRLTWVNYSQKLTESFHKFLTSEILCNVTLWVHESGGGSSIKAHQAILSACSPWFEKILSQNAHPHPIIILKDVRYHDLKNIIRYSNSLLFTSRVIILLLFSLGDINREIKVLLWPYWLE